MLAHPVDGSKDKIGADEFAILNSGNAVDRTLLAFLQTLRVERSRSTVRAYTADLLKFRKWVQGKSAWQQVPKQLIEDFISEEIASGLNANSSARAAFYDSFVLSMVAEKRTYRGEPYFRIASSTGQ